MACDECGNITIPKGPQGSTGPTGPTGTNGTNGTNGSNGDSGTSIPWWKYPQQATTNTSDQVLDLETLPGATWTTDQSGIKISGIYSSTDPGKSQSVTLKLGTNIIYTDIFSSSYNIIAIEAELSRISSTEMQFTAKSQRYQGTTVSNRYELVGTISPMDLQSNIISGLNFNNEMDILFEANSFTAGDITLEMSKGELYIH